MVISQTEVKLKKVKLLTTQDKRLESREKYNAFKIRSLSSNFEKPKETRILRTYNRINEDVTSTFRNLNLDVKNDWGILIDHKSRKWSTRYTKFNLNLLSAHNNKDVDIALPVFNGNSDLVIFDIDNRQKLKAENIVRILVEDGILPENAYYEYSDYSGGFHVYVKYNRPVFDNERTELQRQIKIKYKFDVEVMTKGKLIRLPGSQYYNIGGDFNNVFELLELKKTVKIHHEPVRFFSVSKKKDVWYSDKTISTSFIEMSLRRKFNPMTLYKASEFIKNLNPVEFKFINPTSVLKKSRSISRVKLISNGGYSYNAKFEFGNGEFHSYAPRIAVKCYAAGLTKLDFENELMKYNDGTSKTFKNKKELKKKINQLWKWAEKKSLNNEILVNSQSFECDYIIDEYADQAKLEGEEYDDFQELLELTNNKFKIFIVDRNLKFYETLKLYQFYVSKNMHTKDSKAFYTGKFSVLDDSVLADTKTANKFARQHGIKNIAKHRRLLELAGLLIRIDVDGHYYSYKGERFAIHCEVLNPTVALKIMKLSLDIKNFKSSSIKIRTSSEIRKGLKEDRKAEFKLEHKENEYIVDLGIIFAPSYKNIFYVENQKETKTSTKIQKHDPGGGKTTLEGYEGNESIEN